MAESGSCGSYLLPSHPSVMMADPMSICEEYDSLEVSKWRMVSKLLRERSLPDFKALEDVLTTFQLDLEVGTLRTVLDTMNPSYFFSTVLPVVCNRALQMPTLFPSGKLPVLSPSGEATSLTLTREQVACLLSHMFLCTLEPPQWSQYWANFGIWYNSGSLPARAYIQTLLTYFTQLADGSGQYDRASGQPGLVTFHRRVLSVPPDWNSLPTVISEEMLIPSHELEPPTAVDAEVDFANKDVGFGVSGSQEEVLLGMSPEACVVMLVVPTLHENETLVIQGARRVGRYKGIGRQVKFVEPWSEARDWSSRSIIAMDALELDVEESQDQILEVMPQNLHRELNKAYCGFAPFRGEPFSLVSTGHWGCGAFGGHKYTKALIQVMAAVAAKTRLVFHDIPETQDFLPQLVRFLALLGRHDVTVGKLHSALLAVGRLPGQLKRSDSSSRILCLLEQTLELHE